MRNEMRSECIVKRGLLGAINEIWKREDVRLPRADMRTMQGAEP